MKEKIITFKRVFIVCLISLFLVYAHQFLVIKESWKPEEITKKVNFSDNEEFLSFNLKKDAYLLKVKYVREGHSLNRITVNNYDIMDYLLDQEINEIITNYVYVPPKMIKEGKNKFNIEFIDDFPASINFRIKNYRKNIEGVGYVLFHDSIFFNKGNKNLLYSGLIWFLISFSLLFLYCFLEKILYVVDKFLFRHFIYSLLPYIILLFGVLIYNFTSKLYAIIFTNYFFCGAGLIFFFLSFIGIISPKIIRKTYILLKKEEINNTKIPKLYRFINTTIIEADKASIFVKVFIVLFIISALFLLLRLKMIAEQLANLAYFSLIIGVILKIVYFIKNKKQ
jgi:hypothetical protein